MYAFDSVVVMQQRTDGHVAGHIVLMAAQEISDGGGVAFESFTSKLFSTNELEIIT